MRKSHRFRPDAADTLLEDRRVLSTITALAPLVDLSTYNTEFGIGTQVNPTLVATPALATGFASPLFNSFVSNGNGLGTAFANPDYLNGITSGLGVGGLATGGGIYDTAIGILGGSPATTLTYGISPLATLAINGGLSGVGAFPPTAGVSTFAGSNYAPTGLAIQTGLFPAILQPAGGVSYYNGLGYTPSVPTSLIGSDYYSSNYTTGVGYLNGLGVTSVTGTGNGFNSGVTPVGQYGLSGANGVSSAYGFLPSTTLSTGNGLATTAGLINGGSILSFSPTLTAGSYTPLSGITGVSSAFTTNPFQTATGLSSTMTTSPFSSPGSLGSSLSGDPFVTPTNFVNSYGFLTY